MGSGGVQGCDTACDDTRCPQNGGSGEKPRGDFEACRGCSRADSSTSAQRPADLGERPLLTSAPGVASHGLRQGAGQSGGLWALPVVDVSNQYVTSAPVCGTWKPKWRVHGSTTHSKQSGITMQGVTIRTDTDAQCGMLQHEATQTTLSDREQCHLSQIRGCNRCG